MSTIKEVLENPITDFTGQGEIVFDDNISLNVRFEIIILRNGKTIGKLFFMTFDYSIYEKHNNIANFRLKGISEKNEEIIAEECILTMLNDNNRFNYPNIKDKSNEVVTVTQEVNATFSCYKFFVNPKVLEIDNKSELIIKFDLINVHHLNGGIYLDTTFGELIIKNYQDIKDIEAIMRLNKLPLITSLLQIDINKNYQKKLKNIKDEIITLIQNLLKITSLSQIT
jgi:hypothetical protein